MTGINVAIERIYETFDGPGAHCDYHNLHQTRSLNVLTVRTPEEAGEVVRGFVHAIRGRDVVEIGAGVGFLAMEMAKHARRVWAIESDPAWSWSFTKFLYATKTPNLTWIFGSAESVAEWLRADVAVIRTRSGAAAMVSVAERMAEMIVLSSCEKPLIVRRGERLLRDVTEYIDRRVSEILAEYGAEDR